MIDSLILNPQPLQGTPNVGLSNDDSFLPRILSVFYAVFHPRLGPQVVYQVPEGSISASLVPQPDSARSPTFSATSIRSPSVAYTPGSFAAGSSGVSADALAKLGEPEPLSLGGSRAPSLTSLVSGGASPRTSHTGLSSPPESSSGTSDKPGASPGFNAVQPASGLSQSRPPALIGLGNAKVPSLKIGSSNAIVDFDSISEYVIPKDRLYGRLVHCNTPTHRILGFPVILYGDRYFRRDFRFNLCFVFDRRADLSCYEQVVRKCATVLMNCEEESGFLSNPQTSGRMYSILEQLYEDLNSFSETSIRIDSFNSIELKIFPFYPNPPKVDDWQVPIALINLAKRVESNWDLTMAKVVPHINGINHVRKIADLADTDPNLTRRCMEHLLFYQCILMVDIFQYSNMYALKPAIQWLAEDASVQAECAPYVTQAGHDHLSWPQLLRLYSQLKRGKTIHTWMEENDIASTGIDVRRFLSFGVIKGFLRRIHRYPILVSRDKDKSKKKRGGVGAQSRQLNPEELDALTALKDTGLGSPTATNYFQSFIPISESIESTSSMTTVHGYRVAGRSFGVMTAAESPSNLSPPIQTVTPTQYFPGSQMRARPRQGSVQSTLSAINTQHASQPYLASTTSITSSATAQSDINAALAEVGATPASWRSSRGPPTPVLSRNSTVRTRDRTTSISQRNSQGGMLSNTISIGGSGGAGGAGNAVLGVGAGVSVEPSPYPDGLREMLDGQHHTDEICSKYGIGWKELEGLLAIIGWAPNPPPHAAAEEGRPAPGKLDLGRVKIINR
ncbi:Nitrogen permease regulator 2 [Tulasnella sp. UAMH 9824]|nr:Nitrogen permease regulator 2 [Tulasnella sp. UAMH 9824]